MVEARNIHVPGGVYYVRMRINSGQELVADAQDAADLDRLAAKAAELCNARVLAFYWGRARGDLLVEIDKAPIGQVMHFLNGSFAQRAQARRGRSGALFRRYRAALVATEGQLLQLVRYIHQMPIKEELARKPADYPHSSHHHYAKPGSSWLSTKRVRDLLRRRGVRDKEAYEQWTTRPVGGRQARQFETARVSLPAPHARLPLTDTVGAPAEALMALEAGDWPSAERALDPARVDPIIEVVAAVLELTRKQILSRESTQRATLARALVTWTGTREGLGSRSSFAQYLGDRACSTINRAIERYRVENKKLFAMTFDELKALAAKRRPDTADRESAQLG